MSLLYTLSADGVTRWGNPMGYSRLWSLRVIWMDSFGVIVFWILSSGIFLIGVMAAMARQTLNRTQTLRTEFKLTSVLYLLPMCTTKEVCTTKVV